MLACDWKTIKGVDCNEMLEFIKDPAYQSDREFMNEFTAGTEITINGEDVSHYLVTNVLFLAVKDVSQRAVTSFLFALDDTEVLQELVSGLFLDIAAKQHKKCALTAAVSGELKRREQERKAQEREQKQLQREVFLSQQQPFFGAEISQNTVKQILSYLGLGARLNTATKKIEIDGKNAEALYQKFSRDNIFTTLPLYITDICRENEVTNGKSGAVTAQTVSSYLFSIADEDRYNPIREMLTSHCNTDPSHLERIYEILGLRSDFDKTLVRKWLIQTVAFAFASPKHPVSAEGVLVLQGKQGSGKTSFFRKISGNPQWFTEGAVIDMRNKDTVITAVSSWICELGEIDSTLKKEQSALKAFITRTVDRIRLPYAAAESEFPRTTSMCGTVNPEQFLKDPTGNRRYWTVNADRIDKQALFQLTQEDIFNLWGYIYHLYQQNKKGFRLNDAENRKLELKNRDYSASQPFELEILDLLDFELPAEKWTWVSPAKLRDYVGGSVKAEQVGRVLSQMEQQHGGIERKRTKKGYQYLLPLENEIRNRLRPIGAAASV